MDKLTADFEDGTLWITTKRDWSTTTDSLEDYPTDIPMTPFNLDRALLAHGYERTGDWVTTQFGLSAEVVAA